MTRPTREYVLTEEAQSGIWISDVYYCSSLDAIAREALERGDTEPRVSHADHPHVGLDVSEALYSALTDEVSDENDFVSDVIAEYGSELAKAQEIVDTISERIAKRAWMPSERLVDPQAISEAMERERARRDDAQIVDAAYAEHTAT